MEITIEEEEKIVAQAEASRASAVRQMEKIWDLAEARVVADGWSAYHDGFWEAVEAEAGEPYQAAAAKVRACYTEQVKRLLPSVRAARKAREQIAAAARHGGGYDNDCGSGYGANTND